jgi:hypothetical protein
LIGADWIAIAVFSVLSAILFFSSVPSYVYPGEGASLVALWKGLDVSSFVKYPVFKAISAIFGYSNLVSPICAVAAAIGIY